VPCDVVWLSGREGPKPSGESEGRDVEADQEKHKVVGGGSGRKTLSSSHYVTSRCHFVRSCEDQNEEVVILNHGNHCITSLSLLFCQLTRPQLSLKVEAVHPLNE